MSTRTVRIVTVPDEDREFNSVVNAALDGIDRDHLPSSTTEVINLLKELLPRYPRMEIHQQNGLASFQGHPNTWYVYRDGALIALEGTAE